MELRHKALLDKGQSHDGTFYNLFTTVTSIAKDRKL